MRSFVLLALACAACSRTGLDADDDLGGFFDGGADGTQAGDAPSSDSSDGASNDAADVTIDGPPLLKCDATNCQGCCDSTGQCHEGHTNDFCGGGGFKCTSCEPGFSCEHGGPTPVCSGEWWQLFDGGGGPTTQCNYENCPSGCCGRIEGISQDIYCIQGDNAFGCGTEGQPCADCSVNGVDCSNHMCVGSVCGGGECQSGCCVGSECLPGTDLHFCGNGSGACADCAPQGDTCQDQQCKPPLCNANTCAGCCVGDVCAVGTQDTSCGKGGAACIDCTTSKQSCSNGACE